MLLLFLGTIPHGINTDKWRSMHSIHISNVVRKREKRERERCDGQKMLRIVWHNTCICPRNRLCMSNWFAVMCAISTRVQVKTFKLKSAEWEICTFNLECIRQFNNNKYLFGHLRQSSSITTAVVIHSFGSIGSAIFGILERLNCVVDVRVCVCVIVMYRGISQCQMCTCEFLHCFCYDMVQIEIIHRANEWFWPIKSRILSDVYLLPSAADFH